MENKNDAFTKEYTSESSTEVPSKATEEEKQDKTVTGQIEFYNKSKPYRVIIKAKEIK